MSSPADPTPMRVVINPTRAEAGAAFLAALEEAEGFSAPVDVVMVDDPADLTDAIERAAADDQVTVGAVGGDGTQRTAAEVLAGRPARLLVVPGGTVNLLAQVLGIHSVEDAVGAAIAGDEQVMDLGVVQGDEAAGDGSETTSASMTFVLNASSGTDARTIARVDEAAKRFGRLGYAGTALTQLWHDRPQPVQVTVDGEVAFTGRAMTVMVANVGQRGSGDFTVAQDAAYDDGRLDVVIQRCDSLPTMLRTGLTLARGRRPRTEDMVSAQGTDIRVRWPRPTRQQVDGDAGRSATTFRHEVRPGALRVLLAPSD